MTVKLVYRKEEGSYQGSKVIADMIALLSKKAADLSLPMDASKLNRSPVISSIELKCLIAMMELSRREREYLGITQHQWSYSDLAKTINFPNRNYELIKKSVYRLSSIKIATFDDLTTAKSIVTYLSENDELIHKPFTKAVLSAESKSFKIKSAGVFNYSLADWFYDDLHKVYTHVDFNYLSKLSSTQTIALYKLCRPYVQNQHVGREVHSRIYSQEELSCLLFMPNLVNVFPSEARKQIESKIKTVSKKDLDIEVRLIASGKKGFQFIIKKIVFKRDSNELSQYIKSLTKRKDLINNDDLNKLSLYDLCRIHLNINQTDKYIVTEDGSPGLFAEVLGLDKVEKFIKELVLSGGRRQHGAYVYKALKNKYLREINQNKDSAPSEFDTNLNKDGNEKEIITDPFKRNIILYNNALNVSSKYLIGKLQSPNTQYNLNCQDLFEGLVERLKKHQLWSNVFTDKLKKGKFTYTLVMIMYEITILWHRSPFCYTKEDKESFIHPWDFIQDHEVNLDLLPSDKLDKALYFLDIYRQFKNREKID
ncbi:hypothetical protein H0A36_26430 [Endozoicomonas sp. SM1973]|uniref:Initiator Rep protein WH1 domain-containing protein n=1 Tax=Spartinivicinus marinus TaxID=2994442 RepID=A0A853IG89_9GAMM|nr:RepB family plasmid replication initiator protein [Spartinivicinus marinus]MCX4030390.1 RepB family plasmid replication initiator protein [Spartinivicinus marinus]NYZ69558.1 hypothetical protein [Spartinivicinus marinus]